MITLQEYCEYSTNASKFKEHIDEIREYNKALIEKYPWLGSGSNSEKDYYDFTWLDDMPIGWRLAFGEQMCEELQEELERINYVDDYVILQVKEKFGSLRWYTGSVPRDSKLFDIVDKYEEMSEKTCIECGRPATVMSNGWISPYCDECCEKYNIKSYVKL